MTTTSLTPGRFTLDPANSSVGFQHKTNWGLGTVRGSFGSVAGTGELAADGSGKGTLTVSAASIDTKNAKRDEHLRSKDFFQVDVFPEIGFDATRVIPDADGGAQVEGQLTIRGTGRPLSFRAKVEPQGTDAVVLHASLDVDRADFGMSWNRVGLITGPASLELRLRFTAAG
jgi:polyisoprenoid-binding protein YceI